MKIYQEQHIIANFATKDFVKTVQLRKHMLPTSTAMMKLPDVTIFTNDWSCPPKECIVHASRGTLLGAALGTGSFSGCAEDRGYSWFQSFTWMYRT